MPEPHGSTGALAEGTGFAAALRYDGYGQTVAAGRERFFGPRFYALGLGTFTQGGLLGMSLGPIVIRAGPTPDR